VGFSDNKLIYDHHSNECKSKNDENELDCKKSFKNSKKGLPPLLSSDLMETTESEDGGEH
jgi:hypothetical protein